MILIKKSKIYTALLLLSFSSVVLADNTAETVVTVNGKVIKALTLNVDEDIRFGELVAPSSGETATSVTITVDPLQNGDFTIGYLSNGSPDVSASGSGTAGTIASVSGNRVDVGPGKITVSGEPDYHYVAVTDPANGNVLDLALAAGGVSMNVQTFSGSRKLNSSGQDVVYLGGSFSTVSAASTVPGTYNSGISVTVTYD